MWYFHYSAFWLTGRWGGAIAPPGYATGVGIASSDHRICLLQFAAVVMLTGLIFVLRMAICQVTKLPEICIYFSPLD